MANIWYLLKTYKIWYNYKIFISIITKLWNCRNTTYSQILMIFGWSFSESEQFLVRADCSDYSKKEWILKRIYAIDRKQIQQNSTGYQFYHTIQFSTYRNNSLNSSDKKLFTNTTVILSNLKFFNFTGWNTMMFSLLYSYDLIMT